jgi:exodeoxyribonuclease-3
MNTSIKLCSVNCRGLSDKTKRRDVLNYLRKKNFSIYCLQDVHWDQKWENMIRAEWGYECFTAGNTSNSRGVAVLLSNNFNFKIRNIKRDEMGNWIALDISMMSMDVSLVCIYMAPMMISQISITRLKMFWTVLKTLTVLYAVILIWFRIKIWIPSII